MTTTELKRLRSKHQPVGRWIRAEKRLAIYLRDGFRCLACGRDLHNAAPHEVSLDHIITRSRGGSNEAKNLYTCCNSCNSSRQDKRLNTCFDPEVNTTIRRHAARSIKRQMLLAKAIIDAKRKGTD